MDKMALYQEALRGAGLRLTEQRLQICEALAATDSHPTPYEVYEDVAARYPEIARATVYNTLNTLQQLGAIVELSFGSDHTHYDTDPTPHVNLICLRCHRIADFPGAAELAALQERLGAAEGFQMLAARADLLGICAACQARGLALSPAETAGDAGAADLPTPALVAQSAQTDREGIMTTTAIAAGAAPAVGATPPLHRRVLEDKLRAPACHHCPDRAADRLDRRRRNGRSAGLGRLDSRRHLLRRRRLYRRARDADRHPPRQVRHRLPDDGRGVWRGGDRRVGGGRAAALPLHALRRAGDLRPRPHAPRHRGAQRSAPGRRARPARRAWRSRRLSRCWSWASR